MPGSIKQPLIFINTETFHINSNISTMQKFLDAPHNAERHLYTIRYSLQNLIQCIKEIHGYYSIRVEYFSSPSFTYSFQMQENNSWKSNGHCSYRGVLVGLVYEKDWQSTSLKDQSCSYIALFTEAHRWEIQWLLLCCKIDFTLQHCDNHVCSAQILIISVSLTF